jgi:PAS domain-containing protein
MGKVEELLNSVDAIIWEWDVREKRYTFVSQQAERILGYPLSQGRPKVSFGSFIFTQKTGKGWLPSENASCAKS